MIVNGFPDREITVNGKSFLYFGGTSYLGLATHSEFQKQVINGIKKWGTSYGSSRNSNIKLSIYNDAEQAFSTIIGTENVLTCSSGTLAGKLVLEHLAKQKCTFYHYPKTHPAILHKTSLPVFMEGKLHPNLCDNRVETVVISADAFLGLEVEPTSFQFLNNIASNKKIILVLDESHSLGIFGKNLKGILNTISNKNIYQKIMVASLGKALGLSGGIIASTNSFIESLKNEPDFVSSSGMNPAFLEAFVNSQEIIEFQQKNLEANLSFLFEELELKPIFKFNKNYPVIYCEDNRVFDFFQNKGIIITNFKYPTYKTVMNRIVITANHTQNDLAQLKQTLIDFNNSI